MKKTVLAAIVGAMFLFPFHTTSQAAANEAEINNCIRAIAQQERSSARNTKGDERSALIKPLGKIKMACVNGPIEQAYNPAAKLQLDPQQADAN